MKIENIILFVVGICLGIPLITYFTIWWGVAAYHRARAYAKRKESDDNNIKEPIT